MNSDSHLPSPLEHIRLRPGMYVGGIDARAMHHLAYEVLDHMMEEVLVGRCNHIWIELKANNVIAIRDNSAGLPVKLMSNGLTQMESLLQMVGVSKKRLEPDIYQNQITGGLHGLGLWSVTALSEQMVVHNWRDGFLWEIVYHRGVPQTPLNKTSLIDPNQTGTLFTFQPDYTIFDPNSFDRDKLIARARHLTYLHPGLSIVLRDTRVDPVWQETYVALAGLKQLIVDVQEASPLHDVIHLRQDVTVTRENKPDLRFGIEIAFQFSQGETSKMYSYINTVEIRDGGTHIAALKTALTRQFNAILKTHQTKLETTPRFKWADIFPGLTAVVSIRHPHPQFVSPTRLELGNREISDPLSHLVRAAFKQMDDATKYRLIEHYLTKRQTERRTLFEEDDINP